MPEGEDATARAVWTFSPRPGPWRTREDGRRLRLGLESALRAGHGLGARFRIRIPGGPESALELSVDDGPCERWAERGLLRAYGPGDWTRSPPVRRAPPLARWSGRRRGLPGESGAMLLEPGRLVHALAAALRVAGRGTSLTVGFRPAPRPRLRLVDAWWPTEAQERRLDRPTRPAPYRTNTAPHAPSPTPSGLAWRVALELLVEPPFRTDGTGPVLDAVRTAWTTLDGQPLVVREVPPCREEPFRNLLSEAEVVALLPSNEEAADPPTPPTGPALGIPVGRCRSGSVASIPVEADQGRHFAVLGETGMGKSSVLVSIALRASRLGGLVVLDPLGETAEAIRNGLVDAGREFLWVAPGAPRVAVNALAGIGAALRTDPVRAERELEDLVHALRRVRAGRYADAAYWGPRLEEMVLRAIRAAAYVPSGTLEDAHALLSGAGSGRTVVPPASQAEVRELAARVRDRPDDAEGARRLLYEVVRNPTLAAMLCAREPALSLPDLVVPGRITLVSGAASRVGESTARYLLASYLALLWSALLARGSPTKTFVLLDEAQWFGHEGLGEMLRLARRRNVHVGLATQSLSSLSQDVRDAVRTNVADLVVFRGSLEEAQELARITPAVPAEAVLGLPRGEAVVLLGKGEAARWVRTARLPDGRGPRELPPAPARASPDVPADTAPEMAFVGGPRPGVVAAPSVELPAGFVGEGLLDDLRARSERLSPGELIEVDLSRWRARGPAGERELRALGSELGRRGAIVRSERGERGAVWWVEPGALASVLADRARGSRRSPAGSPQRL